MLRTMKKKTKIAIICVILVAAVLGVGTIVYFTADGSLNELVGTVVGDPLTGLKSVLPVDTTVTLASSSMDLNMDTDLKFDWSDFFRRDFSSFDAELAKFNFLMCIDAQDNGRVTVDGAANTDDADNASFPASLGFCETFRFPIGENESENPNDTTTMVVSTFTYSKQSSYVYYINVSFTGTDGSAEQWMSNFDIGADDSCYPGSDSDWVNKLNHKGFDVTATRAIEILKKYFQTLDISGSYFTVVGFNGYSRGAAIANIAASRFYTSDFDLCRNAYAYAYTFAAPNTTAEDASSYTGIFNIINQGDIVTILPPDSMGFHRYGQDVVFDLSTDSTLSSRYTQITGVKYGGTNDQALLSAMEPLCADRVGFYTVDTDADSSASRSGYKSEAEAEAGMAAMKSKLKNYCPNDLDHYVHFSEITPYEQLYANGKTATAYRYSYCISPAFIGEMVPSLLDMANSGASTSSLLSAINLVNFGKYSLFTSEVVRTLAKNSSSVKSMHYPVPYFLYIDSLS